MRSPNWTEEANKKQEQRNLLTWTGLLHTRKPDRKIVHNMIASSQNQVPPLIILAIDIKGNVPQWLMSGQIEPKCSTLVHIFSLPLLSNFRARV